MSDSPDDQHDGDRDGQKSGGDSREARPTGTQTRGGQPQGGQPEGDQPQGQYPQTGRQPPGRYQRRPGYGEIFDRPATTAEIKLGVSIFAAVSLGLGISGVGLSLASSGSGTGMVFGGVGLLIIFGALLLSPLIAGVLGLRTATELADQPTNLVYGTAAVVGFAGTIVAWIIGIVFFLLASASQAGGGGGIIGELVLTIFVGAIGVAITGGVAAWAGTTFSSPAAQ